MKAILNMMVKGFLMSLMALGIFAVAAYAQPRNTKKFVYKLDERMIRFATPAFDFAGGKIVVNGEVRDFDVSRGSGGCFTMTVNTYKIALNGERILVRSRSKQICKTERLPEVVIDRVPRGKYLVEIEIDRPLINEERLGGELTVAIESERINLQ